jgi:hypothetical protein
VSLPRRRGVLARLALTIKIVSTVLRPVGPHESRVYWLRRAVLLGVIVVIVVVLVAVLSGGSAKPKAKPKSTPHPSTTTSSPAANTQVAPCSPAALKLVLSTDSDTYTSGDSAQLVGAFTNPGATPCTLALTPASEVWTITSGADKIWTTKGCSKLGPTQSKTIHLKAGGTKNVSLSWDGHRVDTGCTDGTAALAGEYVLRATLAGVKGKPAVFHVTS